MCNANEAVSDNQNTDNSTEPGIQKKWNSIVTKNELRKLLNMIGMKDFKISSIIPNNENSSDRHGVLLNLNDRYDEEAWSIVIIDFRLGNPTWEQFIDVTYNENHCDFSRCVIVYDNYYEVPNVSAHTENDITIYDLVRNNNKCGLDTFLIKADGIAKRFTSGGHEKIKYEIQGTPAEGAGAPVFKYIEDDFPTKEQVQEMAKNVKCVV